MEEADYGLLIPSLLTNTEHAYFSLLWFPTQGQIDGAISLREQARLIAVFG
jgi:hypothetical protein